MRPSFVTCIAILTSFATSSPFRRQNKQHKLGIPQSLQTVLDNTRGNPAYTYPTDLTRDIIPKPIHSHNDCWRDVPFFSALSVGAISVEADVWLFENELYVGHDILALSKDRTFDSLYVQPILNTLNRQNPPGLFTPSTTKHGVFDTTSDQTLYLWIDVKEDGDNAWPRVVEALQPLRDAGYLTTLNGTNLIQGAVTVIGTGATPLDQIEGVTARDYFYDANAALLDSDQSHFNSTISPIASLEFSRYVGPVDGTALNDIQLALVRSQIATAKSKGIGVRYWDTPAYPISKRNAVWNTLVTEGVALLNADDLSAAAGLTGPASW